MPHKWLHDSISERRPRRLAFRGPLPTTTKKARYQLDSRLFIFHTGWVAGRTDARHVRVFFDLVVPAQFDFYRRVVGETEHQQRVSPRGACYILAKQLETITEWHIYKEALKELEGRVYELARADVMRTVTCAHEREKPFSLPPYSTPLPPYSTPLFTPRLFKLDFARASVKSDIHRNAMTEPTSNSTALDYVALAPLRADAQTLSPTAAQSA
jgi:hypothetical protein